MNTLGIDLGYGANKMYGNEGGKELPSQVAIANGRGVFAETSGSMKTAKAPLLIEVNGTKYYSGNHAHEWGRPVETLDYQRLNGTPEMKAVLYAAMTQYEAGAREILTQPLKVIVGMPIQPLTGEPAEVAQTVTMVKQWLKGHHNWTANGKECAAIIEDVIIASQPTGAFYDYVLDDSGNFYTDRKALIAQEVGIISIGFNTIEMMVTQKGQANQRFTSGETNGVRRLLELMNPEGLYSLGEIDTAIRSKAKTPSRENLTVWGREFSGQVERIWGKNWPRFGRVLVVGGGAILLKEQIYKTFKGKAVIPDSPVMSIARGLYKLSLMQQQKASNG